MQCALPLGEHPLCCITGSIKMSDTPWYSTADRSEVTKCSPTRGPPRVRRSRQKSNSSEDENPANDPTCVPPKSLQSKPLNDEADWSNFSNIIQERLHLLDNRKEHLMGLAQSARLRIEEINHPCVNNDQQNLNDVTNRTLNELHSASFKAFQSQTLRLPKTVLSLINN